MTAVLAPLAVFLAVVYLTIAGLLVHVGLDKSPSERPKSWPWGVLLWPIFLSFELYLLHRDRQRLRRMKAEVWKR